MDAVTTFANKHNKPNPYPDLRPGWTIKVHQKIERADSKGKGGKSQVFEGIIVSRKHGNEAGATITVRRAAGNFGVEKTYPLRLPSIEKIEVVKRSKVRRAKLFFLREKSSREIRRKTRVEMNAEKIEKIEVLRAEQAERRAEEDARLAKAAELRKETPQEPESEASATEEAPKEAAE